MLTVIAMLWPSIRNGYGRPRLRMLLQQAVSSFRIWTGRDAPVEVMRAALFASVS